MQRPGYHSSSGTVGRDKALGWGGDELCHGMAQTRGGGEEGGRFFFSLSNHLKFIVKIVFI